MIKKIIPISIFIIIVIALSTLNKDDNKNNIKPKEDTEIRGIYISYIEYQNHFQNKNDDQIKKEIDTMINNISNDRFNLILLHVRPFSDSIYNSYIYPYSYTVSGTEGEKKLDILDYFINRCHDKDIKIHAWINPYRIRNTSDTKSLTVSNPSYKWLGTNNVKIIEDKGIYYNPASSEVENLLINGIKEIIENYNVDGIHFDDYFYPSNDIDKDNYQEYLNSGGKLSKKEYRLQIINNMIKKVYKTIKDYNKKIVFSIAPEGNIENNYNNNYADILTWLKEEGYVDYIMPQIYYGFENSNKPFIKTLISWSDYIKNNNIKFIPALAFYKIGNIDNYAGEGKNEWVNGKNIIANQVKTIRTIEKTNGFIIFRYDSYYSDSKQVLSEKEELQKLY